MSSSSTPRSPAAGEKALSIQTSADSFDENNPPSPKLRGLSKFVSTSNVLHQVPDVVLNTIMGTPRDENDDGSTSSKLKIEVIQAISSDEAVVKWSFSIEGGKTSIEIVVKLKVTKRMDGDITVSAESVELPSASIEEPSNLRTKLVRIVLEKGIISLQPEKLEQTAFTFSAKAGIAIANGGENEKKTPNADRVNSSTSSTSPYSTKKKITPLSLPSFKSLNQDVEDLVLRIPSLLYDLFEREEIIDDRIKADFIKNIKSPPQQTDAERNQIAKSADLVRDITSKARRIAGTVLDPVEKYIHQPPGEAVWGLSITKMDVPATTLLAELWCLDTYEKLAYHKSTAIRELYKDIDGTRGMEYSLSVGLPSGFQSRLFQSWYTWEGRTEADGRKNYIVSYIPLQEYKGTRHEITGDQKMVRAGIRGVYIVKELTDNTCEWTWAQQLDLKIKAMTKKLLAFIVWQQLGWVDEMYEKFKRNGMEVDRENREVLIKVMKARRGTPLMEDQVEIFERCSALLGEEGGGGWKPLSSKNAEVKMAIKYFPPKKGERSVLTGKAVGVVDSSAEEVAAWVMDYCSNGRMRVSREEDNSPRLELREKRRENEATFVTVKPLTVLLDKREFVFRMIWRSEEGKMTVAIESIDDEVDYGARLRMTRGFCRCLYVIESLPIRSGVEQCRVTFVQNIDAGGIIPTWVVDKNTGKALNIIQEIVDEFRQDEKVDAAEIRELTTFIREAGEEEVYSEEEEALIKRVRQKFLDSLKEGNWRKLRSPDNFVTMESIEQPGNNKEQGTLIGRSVTVVDATIEQCAAWNYNKMTREKLNERSQNGELSRKMIKINNHSDLYYLLMDVGVAGLKPREWLVRMVWKVVDENTIWTSAEDVKHDDFPIGGGKGNEYVRGSADAFYKFEKLPDVRGVPQTRVTYCQNVDLKGNIPKIIANNRVTKVLAYLSRMRVKFDRSEDFDVRRRAELGRMIKKAKSTQESSAEALKRFEDLYSERRDCEQPRKDFGLAHESKVHATLFGGHGWGRTSVKVRAELTDVAAFFWDFGSRAGMRISADVERTFQTKFVEGELILTKEIQRRQKLESHLGVHHTDRTFNSIMTLTWTSSDTIVLSVIPQDEDGKSVRGTARSKSERARGSVLMSDKDAVTAKENVVIRLKKVGDGKTKLDYACHVNLGLGVSHRSTQSFVEGRIHEMHAISVYFQRITDIELYRKHDGQALAYDILWNVHSSKHRVERLDLVAKENKALKDLLKKYPSVNAILSNVLKGNLNMNRVVNMKLECIGEKEGTQIGKNLIPSLMTEALPEAGVNEWRVNNRAVRELVEKHPWFEAMAVVIGRGIVKTAHWGLMGRVVFGALVSMSDLATDCAVLWQYWEGGEEMLTYRNLSIVSLSCSMLLQLMVAYFQNRNAGSWKVFKECLIVLFGLKAPWDAYRVAMGAEHEAGAIFEPLMEMTLSKCVELFTESIPAILIQTAAILNVIESGGTFTGENRVTKTSLTSLFVSVMAVGFVSATISYDFDTDPKRRAENPEFYGYVPDSSKKRPIMFSAMINMTASSVLIKCILICVLGRIDSIYPWYYLGLDVVLFIVIKMARNDFSYWFPIEGRLGTAISLLVRPIEKVIADFTGCVHLRHPIEVGGLNFTLNYFIPFFALSLLLFLQGDELFKGEHTQEVVETTVKILGASLFLWTFVFFVLMNKEFRKTFYSIETGKQHAANLFFEGNDLIKANSLGSHSSYWKEFEEPLQIWLNEGWSSWEDEKPDWFTEAWRKRVPEHMVTQASTSASGSAFSEISTQGSGRSIGKGAGGRGTRGEQHKNVVKNLKATQILPALGGNQEEGLGYTENHLKNAMGRRGSMRM